VARLRLKDNLVNLAATVDIYDTCRLYYFRNSFSAVKCSLPALSVLRRYQFVPIYEVKESPTCLISRTAGFSCHLSCSSDARRVFTATWSRPLSSRMRQCCFRFRTADSRRAYCMHCRNLLQLFSIKEILKRYPKSSLLCSSAFCFSSLTVCQIM